MLSTLTSLGESPRLSVSSRCVVSVTSMRTCRESVSGAVAMLLPIRASTTIVFHRLANLGCESCITCTESAIWSSVSPGSWGVLSQPVRARSTKGSMAMVG